MLRLPFSFTKSLQIQGGGISIPLCVFYQFLKSEDYAVKNTLTEYQQQLVTENLKIVDRVIRSRIIVTNTPLQHYEDYYQVGCEALCHAAIDYRPDLGPFTAVANTYVYHAMICHSRAELTQLKHSLGTPVGSESGAERDDAFIDAREPFSFVFDAYCSEVLAACKNRYRGITRQGIEAIEMELLGFSSKEIAGRYGTTVNNINAWISRARKKLKTDGDFLKALS